METNQTFISLKEMREFYKEECEDTGRNSSEKEFEAFVDCCERDFYQWLSDNLKYFKTEYRPTVKMNTMV